MPLMMHTTLDGWLARRRRLVLKYHAAARVLRGEAGVPDVPTYFAKSLEIKSLGHILIGRMPDDGRPA